ncbi:MAG: sigma-70 family RNA polymerase sigma factor [Planctomycetota bacterium]
MGIDGAGGLGSLSIGAAAPPITDEQAALDAQLAADGDPEALQRLWAHHRRWIAAVILAHKPREADLEDLLQEVALSLVRNVETVRDPQAVKPWLRTVAINAARAAGRTVTRRKRLRPEVRAAVLDRAPESPNPTDQVAQQDTSGGLLGLAQQLPEGYREPLLLRVARGMTYREIAAVTGLTETTIETRIARGRRMLRELARERLEDGESSTKACQAAQTAQSTAKTQLEQASSDGSAGSAHPVGRRVASKPRSGAS